MALIEMRSGCKVGWETYDNLPEAEARARDAAEARERMFTQGYDFGFQWPGAIKHWPVHPTKPELGECWEVTVP